MLRPVIRTKARLLRLRPHGLMVQGRDTRTSTQPRYVSRGIKATWGLIGILKQDFWHMVYSLYMLLWCLMDNGYWLNLMC